MTTRVLITGIAGFIGSHVVEKFSKRKFDIFGLDNFSTGSHENLHHVQNKVQEIGEGGIEDPVVVFQAFKAFNPEVVIHLAAQPSLLTSIKYPDFDLLVNGLGTINILRGCEAAGVERFIFTSTSAITSDHVVTEGLAHTMSPPKNPYGMSKRMAEYYIRLLRKEAVIMRLGNVYGPRQVPLGENQLVPRVIKHIMYGDEFSVYGTGTQSRDYIYASDVAEAIYQAATSRLNHNAKPINIGTGKNHTTLDVVNEIYDLFDKTPDYEHTESKDQREHVKMKVDIAKTRYGWKPKVDLKKGLKKTVSWWKQVQKESNGQS